LLTVCGDIHQSHAVIEGTGYQSAYYRAYDSTFAAHYACAADNGRRNGVELEHCSGAGSRGIETRGKKDCRDRRQRAH
jgi:hypothetical protein